MKNKPETKIKYFGIDNFEMNVEISKIEYKEI
jgi:hypothetical protein